MNTETIQLVIQGGFCAVCILLLWWQHQERKDMAKRIRQLEESRAEELKQSAQAAKVTAEALTEALMNNTRVMREICDVLRSRPCLADPIPAPQPQSIPQIHSDTLQRKTR